jgi:hypothetical protein
MSDQDGSRLSRGRSMGRGGLLGGDPLLMAIPRGTGDSELIGGDTSGASSGDGPRSAAFPGWADDAPAGGAPLVCKFLRSIGADGKLSDPGTDAVPTHRCAAFGDPLPLSLRQQELVCLQRVHVSCPRYMRGTLLADETAAAAVAAAPRTGMPYLTIAGLGLVAVAGVAAIAAMLGLLPGSSNASHSPAASLVAAASTTATPSTAPTLTLNPTPTASVAPTGTPLGPTASPTTAPTAAPVPSATWPPGATASRMKLLTPCPGQTNCYIYVVRGPGPSGNGSSVADTVKGIATFFGVNLNTVYSMNPGSSSGVHPGDKLKIPSPTR